MKRTLRNRMNKTDVELSLWKILPIIFFILLYMMSFVVGSGGPSAARPPVTN